MSEECRIEPMRWAPCVLLAAFMACRGDAETLLEWNFYSLTGTNSTAYSVASVKNLGVVKPSIYRESGIFAGPVQDHCWTLSIAHADSLEEAILEKSSVSFGFFSPREGPRSYFDVIFEDLIITFTPLNPSPDQIHFALFTQLTGFGAKEQLGETLTVTTDGSSSPLELILPNLYRSPGGTNTFQLFIWSSNATEIALGDPTYPAGPSISFFGAIVPEVHTASLMAVLLLGLFVGVGARPLFFRRARPLAQKGS